MDMMKERLKLLQDLAFYLSENKTAEGAALLVRIVDLIKEEISLRDWMSRSMQRSMRSTATKNKRNPNWREETGVRMKAYWHKWREERGRPPK